MLSNKKNKILSFYTALSNVYKDEENREDMPKLELKEEELTEDFTCMIHALSVLYNKITGDKTDIIGFSHIVNRLVIQDVMVPKDK